MNAKEAKEKSLEAKERRYQAALKQIDEEISGATSNGYLHVYILAHSLPYPGEREADVLQHYRNQGYKAERSGGLLCFYWDNIS